MSSKCPVIFWHDYRQVFWLIIHRLYTAFFQYMLIDPYFLSITADPVEEHYMNDRAEVYELTLTGYLLTRNWRVIDIEITLLPFDGNEYTTNNVH